MFVRNEVLQSILLAAMARRPMPRRPSRQRKSRREETTTSMRKQKRRQCAHSGTVRLHRPRAPISNGTASHDVAA